MDKLYATISSLTRRVRLAAMVFREGPDDVVALTEQPDGTVHFRHPYGMGIAQNRVGALNGVATSYSLAGHGSSVADEIREKQRERTDDRGEPSE